ncbi:MAG: ABC transporter ATP-binding protein [Rhodobacteraceae bacterium]|nr:ABC transporter ATP-binding protein [Paracoccaceae bacterium]
MTSPLMELRDIKKHFTKKADFAGKIAQRFGAATGDETVFAVDGVNLTIAKGEVLGLVGESGCGKSTLGRIVAGIHQATSGDVSYGGLDLSDLTKSEQARVTLEIQMIFQDPFSSLNPRMRVEQIVGEAPLVHGLCTAQEQSDYVDQVLTQVGLDPMLKRRYPHQFSGGQRQRIGIARALAVKPKFLVCDESIAALDVSIQAQVINLFMELRDRLDLTYLFISHDLSVVQHISDRIAIMYLGRIVEVAPTEELFAAPNHPYTQALLSEVPRIDQRNREFGAIKGEIPSPLDPPSGCHFHPRCPFAQPICSEQSPPTREISKDWKSVCHFSQNMGIVA